MFICVRLLAAGGGSMEGTDPSHVAEIHPHEECLAHDVLVRHKSPEA
jgi:hypothetical protein